MRNPRIERMIPRAVDILQAEVADPQQNTRIPKPFKGYYASFGASVVQSGLLPAVIFFSQSESGSEDKRWKVPYTIYRLMFPEQQKDKTADQAAALQKHLLGLQRTHGQVPERDYQQVLEAALALKLALRTFEIPKE